MVKHDDWWTQKPLFNELCIKNKVVPQLDVAASEQNHLCEKYFTKEDDALTQSWRYQYHDYVGAADVWCNPPNSILKKFIRKAHVEWQEWGMNLLMILPCQAFSSVAFIDTIWKDYTKQDFIGQKIDIQSIFPRPVFLEHGQIPDNASARSYMSVLFKHK